jgi:hypothetical protein
LGRRLIITHGERTTRHELGEDALVVGRDPGCDVFFVDQKLSRRHARFEPGPEGVTLFDLGSRNGTWVNEERVDKRSLEAGDQVRLGGLLITLEVDPPPPPPSPPPPQQDTERTVLLSPPAADEERTVMLGTGALRAEPQPEEPEEPDEQEAEEKTVLLRGGAPSPEEKTAKVERTVLLSPSAADAGEAGTQIFRPPAAEPAAAGPEATLIRPSTARLPRPPAPTPAPAPAAAAPRVVEQARRRAAALPWGIKFVLLLAGLGLLAYLVLAVPLVNTMRTALREESLLRGRALLNYLAAMNAPILGANRTQDLSTEMVLKEPGVKDALILDLNGRVLAPSIRSSENFETIPGVDKKVGEIFTFYLGRNDAGDYNLVLPLIQRGQRVGIAVLTYSAAGVAERGSVPALLVLGFLIIAGGVYAATIFARKITLTPLVTLQDDVESVIKGDSEFVPGEQAFKELADLAESVNRLIERIPSAAPELTPVLFPAPEPAPYIPPSPVSPPKVAPEPAWPPSEPEPYTPEPPRWTPAAPPAPEPSAPAVSPPVGAGGADLSVDGNFIVTRADQGALALLGARSSEVEGKHLIEAIKEQALLEVVLDLINSISESGTASGQAQVPGAGPLSVTVRREASGTVVSFAKR